MGELVPEDLTVRAGVGCEGPAVHEQQTHLVLCSARVGRSNHACPEAMLEDGDPALLAKEGVDHVVRHGAVEEDTRLKVTGVTQEVAGEAHDRVREYGTAHESSNRGAVEEMLPHQRGREYEHCTCQSGRATAVTH